MIYIANLVIYGQNIENSERHFPCLLYISIQNGKLGEGEMEGKKKFQPDRKLK
jgi:hypothetical protein